LRRLLHDFKGASAHAEQNRVALDRDCVLRAVLLVASGVRLWTTPPVQKIRMNTIIV
jgi:hypothetical protein